MHLELGQDLKDKSGSPQTEGGDWTHHPRRYAGCEGKARTGVQAAAMGRRVGNGQVGQSSR